MNRFICGLLCSFWLTKVNGLGIPDYATFFQDPEASDENAVFDDSTDFWFADADADADAVNKNDDCLSYDGFDHLFSSNVVRLRPRDTCTNPAAAPLSPYTDIYNTNDILNQLSPSPPPSSPDTEKDSNVLDLEHQLNLPSFDPAPKTTTTDNDDICPEEYFGDSRIPVCDIGSFIRNGECPPDSVYFNIYGVRPCRFSSIFSGFSCPFFFFFHGNSTFAR